MQLKTLFLLLLIATCNAQAGTYKCVSHGKTAYQDHPCDGTTKSIPSQFGETPLMAGCYKVKFGGWDNNKGTTEIIRISDIGNDDLRMSGAGIDEKTSVKMKNATPEEMKAVGDAFHINIKQGVSMKWGKGTSDTKPVGLYRGVINKNEDVIFAFFFMKNGSAKQIACT